MEQEEIKIAAMYCVYNDDEWLLPSVQGVYKCVDHLYFFVSDQPWNGSHYETRGQTIERIADLPDPENKITIVEGSWDDQVVQRNQAAALMQIQGYTHALIIDADEIYDPTHFESILNHCRANPQVDCWHILSVVFWKSHRYRIDPPDDYRPPIILKLGAGGFVEYRNPRCEVHELVPPNVGFCYHMSFARTNEQILRKISSCSFAPLVRSGWYEQKWLRWDDDHSLGDLHPYQEGQFQKTLEVPESTLPAHLLEYVRQRDRL